MRVIKDERCFQRQVKVVEIPNVRIISLTQDFPRNLPFGGFSEYWVTSVPFNNLPFKRKKKNQKSKKQKLIITTTNKTKITKTRDKTTFSGVIKLRRAGAS